MQKNDAASDLRQTGPHHPAHNAHTFFDSRDKLLSLHFYTISCTGFQEKYVYIVCIMNRNNKRVQVV